jgi:ribosome-binding protein aMBF1 (putative translation factor)
MVTAPMTVVEVEPFPSRAAAIWSDDERSAFIDFIARNPVVGRIIPGTGGVRKARWSRPGLGKRGGARIVYYFYNADRPIYLLTAYAKARKRDLTPAQKRDHHRNHRADPSGVGRVGKSERTVSVRAEDDAVDVGEDIIRGLRNALAHARGDPGDSRQHVVQIPAVDVKVARQKLQMSQDQLARVLCVSPATVRSWEHGERRPEGAARILLRVIEREPDAVLRALCD